MKKGDVRAAADFVRTYDDPFMKNFSHAFWRASMAHFGVSQRYMRPLDKSYTEEQMAEVATFWKKLGVSAENRQ